MPQRTKYHPGTHYRFHRPVLANCIEAKPENLFGPVPGTKKEFAGGDCVVLHIKKDEVWAVFTGKPVKGQKQYCFWIIRKRR
jgi:hypothetical protein